MNEQIATDVERLVAEATASTGPTIASILELIDEYEAGNFEHGWGGTIRPGLAKHLSPDALVSMIRIYHYLNELIRAQYAARTKRDSSRQGDSK